MELSPVFYYVCFSIFFDFESAEGRPFSVPSSHHDFAPSDYFGMSDYRNKRALCFALSLIGSYIIYGRFLDDTISHRTYKIQSYWHFYVIKCFASAILYSCHVFIFSFM
jgi:hypothetical protein